MTPGLDRLPLTRPTRVILGLADGCGLRPHVGPDGPDGYGRGRTAVAIDSGMRNGLFGTIVIDRNARILRAFLLHGNWGQERRYEGAEAVHTVIKSWAAVNRSMRSAG